MKIKSLAEPHIIKLFRYLYKERGSNFYLTLSIDESIAFKESVQHFLKLLFTFLIVFKFTSLPTPSPEEENVI